MTLLSLFVGYPMAYFIASIDEKKRGILLLFALPASLVELRRADLRWLPLLGRNGLVNVGLLQLGLISEPLDWLLYNEGATHIGLVYV